MKDADNKIGNRTARDGAEIDVNTDKNGRSTPRDEDEGRTKDALKEALNMAQSVGDRRSAKDEFGGFGLSSFDDSVSLYEYIDEAEKRSKTLFDSPSFGTQRPVEDLDGLNIAAEFGRPDEGTDDADGDFSDVSIIPLPPSEDTKDLKLPSTPPSPARKEIWETSSLSEESRKSESNVLLGAPFDGLEIRGKRLRGGKLENERLWEVLIAAFRANFRGVCILDVAGETRSLLINDGDVLESATTSPQSDLLSLLVREKYLTEESMKAVRREMSTTEGVKYRDVLLKKGMVRLPEINRCERYHHESLAVEAMGWSRGSWRIEPISTIREMPDAPIETPLPAMILRGLMDSPDTIQLQQGFSGGVIPNPVTPFPFSLAEMSLDAMQEELMRTWDGTVSLRESCELVAGPDERKFRFAAAMQLLGFVNVQKVKHEAAPVSVDIKTPSKPPLTETLKETLARKIKVIENGNYFEILEVESDAGDVAIEAARRRLTALFDVQKYWEAGNADCATDVALVREIVEEAYDVLKEPVRRGRYRKAALDGRDKL